MNGFESVRMQAQRIGLVAEEHGLNVCFKLESEADIGYNMPLSDLGYMDTEKKDQVLRNVRRQLESAFDFRVL